MSASTTSRFVDMGRKSGFQQFERRAAHLRRPRASRHPLDFFLDHPVGSVLLGLGLGVLIHVALSRR